MDLRPSHSMWCMFSWRCHSSFSPSSEEMASASLMAYLPLHITGQINPRHATCQINPRHATCQINSRQVTAEEEQDFPDHNSETNEWLAWTACCLQYAVEARTGYSQRQHACHTCVTHCLYALRPLMTQPGAFPTIHIQPYTYTSALHSESLPKLHLLSFQVLRQTSFLPTSWASRG